MMVAVCEILTWIKRSLSALYHMERAFRWTNKILSVSYHSSLRSHLVLHSSTSKDNPKGLIEEALFEALCSRSIDPIFTVERI